MIILDLLKTVFDRPLLKCKIMLRRRGWKFGTLFFIGNVIWVWCGAIILALFIPILLMDKFCNVGGPIKSDNVLIKFLCDDWGLIDRVADGLFFPMIIFWAFVNFLLMFFGRGQFLK